MIVFDLCCPVGHRFEGWFSSSDDYQSQQSRALVACPQCGATDVSKAPMAPAVPMKGNQKPAPAVHRPGRQEEEGVPVSGGTPSPEVAAALKQLAAMQTALLKQSTWVGDTFAEQSRAMHYGEREAATIHGKATPAEAKALIDEGIAVAPLPFPVSPPEELN